MTNRRNAPVLATLFAAVVSAAIAPRVFTGSDVVSRAYHVSRAALFAELPRLSFRHAGDHRMRGTCTPIATPLRGSTVSRA